MESVARQLSENDEQSHAYIDSGVDAAQERVGFELGWDYAYYGLPCPDDDSQVRMGYSAGANKFGRNRSAKGFASESWRSRYTRKWLSIRINAWRRRRIVSELVTAQYLERIDAKICPILGIPLTHGTGGASDWSVDRINNDGAYAPGNLVVLSVKANKAKGNLSFKEVLELSKLTEDTRSLTPVQWLRLASLMAAPCMAEGEPAPMLPLLLGGVKDVPLLFSQYLQAVLFMELRAGRFHVMRPIRKGALEREDQAGFDTLIKKLRKREQMAPQPDEFWLHPGLFSHFCEWLSALKPKSLVRIKRVLAERAFYEAHEPSLDEWCLGTKGYYEREEEEVADSPQESPNSLQDDELLNDVLAETQGQSAFVETSASV